MVEAAAGPEVSWFSHPANRYGRYETNVSVPAQNVRPKITLALCRVFSDNRLKVLATLTEKGAGFRSIVDAMIDRCVI
jgi:outer membrane lipopolysaccharide assembly protein LptE/RlpB